MSEEEILTISCDDIVYTLLFDSMDIIRELLLLTIENGVTIPKDLKEDIISFQEQVKNYVCDEDYDEE